MSRRGKTYKRIATMLIKQGNDLMENGRALREEHDDFEEGRARECAGWVVSDVGKILLMKAQHRKDMRRLRQILKMVREGIKKQKNEEPGVPSSSNVRGRP